MNKIVTSQWSVFAVLIVVLFAVGCTDPTAAPAPAPPPQVMTASATATMVAPTPTAPAVPTKAAGTTNGTTSSGTTASTSANTFEEMWQELFVIPPVEEQAVRVDPGSTSATLLWLKKQPPKGTPLYLAPMVADGAALRAAASSPQTLALAALAFGVYYISQNKPLAGSWTTYQAGASTVNLTPLLPQSILALMDASTRFNATVNGKPVSLPRNYVSPDAAYTVTAKGQTFLAGWAAIKTLVQASPTGGITFKTGVGDVVVQLTKVGAGRPPDQCAWYWTVTVPGLKNTVAVCFDDLLPFIEALKNGTIPPGLSMVAPRRDFALPV